MKITIDIEKVIVVERRGTDRVSIQLKDQIAREAYQYSYEYFKGFYLDFETRKGEADMALKALGIDPDIVEWIEIPDNSYHKFVKD